MDPKTLKTRTEEPDKKKEAAAAKGRASAKRRRAETIQSARARPRIGSGEEVTIMNEGAQGPQGVWSTNLPSDAVAQVSFGEFKKYMADEMKDNKSGICEELAVSLAKVSNRTDENKERIDEMSTDLKAIRIATDPANLRKEMVAIIREEREREGQSPDDPLLSVPPGNENERSYWWARRCLRIWPIHPAGPRKLSAFS